MAMATQFTPHWKLPTIQSTSTTPSNNTKIRHTTQSTLTIVNPKPALSPKPSEKHYQSVRDSLRKENQELKELNKEDATSTKESFLEIRKRLEQSRKTFLNEQKGGVPKEIDKEKQSGVINNLKTKNTLEKEKFENLNLKKELLRRLSDRQQFDEGNNKRPIKKISFKIRKNASIYRRKTPEVKPANLVQELTKKFNELDEQREKSTAAIEKPKIVKRNSNGVKRKNSCKDLLLLKSSKTLENNKENRTTSVKQAILIFEQKCSTTVPSTPKPEVPAKTFNIREIAMRNQEKRMRLRQQKETENETQKLKKEEVNETNERIAKIPRCSNNNNDGVIVALCSNNFIEDLENNGNGNTNLGIINEKEEGKEPRRSLDGEDDGSLSLNPPGVEQTVKMDAGIIDTDELQVVSLPMGVVKRCESNYEWQKFGQYEKCTLKATRAKSQEIDSNVLNSIKNDNILEENCSSQVEMEEKSILDNAKPNDYEKINRTIIRSSITHQTISNNWLKSTLSDSKTYFLDDENGSWIAIESEDNKTNYILSSNPNKTEEGDYDIVIPPDDDGVTTTTTTENSQEQNQEQCPPLPPRGKLKYNTIKISSSSKNILITDDDYEIPEVPPDSSENLKEQEENIYESLSRCSRRSSTEKIEIDKIKISDGRMTIKSLLKDQREPLPPRPSSPSSSIDYNDESNYYESIYSKRDDSYESIYGGSRVIEDAFTKDKRHSLSGQSIHSDQQSNSIYGRSITSWAEEVLDTYITRSSISGSVASGSGKAVSELSGSSDDWVDISDHENDGTTERGNNLTKFVIVREARHQKVTKKNSGWSQRIRGQWNKVPKKMNQNGDSDSDHTYETLYNCNGMPLAQNHNNQSKSNISSTKQQSQGQHTMNPRIQVHSNHSDADGHIHEDDDDFDSFESDSESDNSFAKNDSGVDMGNTQLPDPPSNHQTYAFTRFAASAGKNVMKRLRRNWSLRKNDISKSLSRITKRKSRTDLEIIEPETTPPPAQSLEKLPFDEKSKTLARKGFLNKFKRSMSMTGDIGDNFGDRSKSTFYLTDPLEIEDAVEAVETPMSSPSPKPQKHLVRPQMPPPPTPTQKSRSQSWYAECGVFKPEQNAPALPRKPNSFWYAEVGLYESGSPPSTASASSSENSGNSTSATSNIVKDDNSDDYYQKNYYNTSVKSFDSTDTKRDEAFNSLQGDIQLRLQDEPLYQFYDAAVLESVCASGLSDYYDDYEEIAKEKRTNISLSGRPSAMELVSPQRNSVSVARTLWCEIPEVLQSTVLSTLSLHQKKLQEAKFEMLTSEASYLNSLHVLTDHFVRKLRDSELLNETDKEVLCGKILPVKECSEKLLLDLEKCWQDNILLHGVCDIVKRHAEENFGVYVAYCENQIILDQTLKRLKEKPLFAEFLKQLEANSICQLLTLYSFLMLPMQRITRWPLLIDAILKRLSPQDDEYQSCQYALATLNKIVTQCNEGARNMERITEMKKLASQMEFARVVPPIELVNGRRWLVRSGALTQMINRGDDIKLTFGKRFNKIPIHLFLFNDIIIVAKSKGEGIFMVQHYCSRSYLELNSESLATLPMKDTQGRHLIFLTILENHEEKTVEMLLACATETDKERWLEALTPPKSENPDETLYECWDCPQITAIHNYIANQPDELPLTRGDVINVTRKMADGWYHGERIRDGETGWFPANYTVEVANPHVRARNLKQRYRLLAYSENYLKTK